MTTIRYAWCFDHGRMHRFDGTPWCTGAWVGFTATTEDEAHAAKHRLYGSAHFLHELVPEVQLEVLHTRQARKART